LLDFLDSYLEDCYAEPTPARVSEIAQRTGLTRQRLSQVFVAQFGKPVRRVMRERQVLKAQELLTIAELSVDEIVVLAAFGTKPTMLKAFREILGMTPTEFRRTLPNFTGIERPSRLSSPSVRKHGRKR
jgi:transcriptional regulator GlxA family with amidase domain